MEGSSSTPCSVITALLLTHQPSKPHDSHAGAAVLLLAWGSEPALGFIHTWKPLSGNPFANGNENTTVVRNPDLENRLTGFKSSLYDSLAVP